MPQYELNIRDYWQIIRKRRGVFIIIFVIVFFLTVIYTNTRKPIYRASASVQLIERKTLGDLLTEIVIETSADPLSTQARIITSLPILEKVAVELGLVTEDATPTEILRKAMGLRTKILTNVIADTSIIRIIVDHGEPEMAANIANKVAEVYITENLREKTKESRSVREFIEGQLEEISAKLKKSEESLVRFKETEVPTGIALPLENKLAELETRQQDLLKIYTPMHPDVKNIEEQMSQLKERLKVMPQKELEYSRLKRDADSDTRLYLDLKNKLAGARISEAEKVEDVSLVDRAYPSLIPIKPNKTLNYLVGIVLGVILSMTGVSLVEQLDTTIGTIEDVESFLKLPALGVIPYLRTKDERKKNFIQRLWPKEFRGEEKVRRLRNQLLVHYSSSSPVFEAYRILRTNIQTEAFKEEKLQRKILLFTSTGPEEGKSITVANLSIAMAQGGLRTLLIDADLRRATIHKIFGLKTEPGLAEVLRGTIDSKDAIRTFTDILVGEVGFDETLKVPGLDNLSILTSGSIPQTPAELLSSNEMANLLESLKERYDIILMDSPPVLAVADPLTLAPKTDGAILVYRVGKTVRAILGRAKAQLTEVGAQVKGVVLNNISPEVEMRYGYYYHYKYYGKYYTDKKT